MPYLGKTPAHGNYSKIDDISGSFDGSDATHPLASGTLAITPVRPEALLISINGVIQEPVTDYTVTGTNITFTTAPAATDSFFGVALGEQLAIGTPSDGTVTSAKLSGDLTLPGDLTIGDASAADAKLVFDGNAQDYHFGLQDSSDDLVIGLGSTLGTTTHMAFDETGAIIKPLQPAVIAKNSTVRNNVTGDNTSYTAVYDTEIVDRNADFASNTFTAPVGGLYLIIGHVWFHGITSSATSFKALITTSNRIYDYLQYWVHTGNQSTQEGGSFSVLADMDASDTATVNVRINGEGSLVSDYGEDSYFMATLIC